jgi:hypothetical protein
MTHDGTKIQKSIILTATKPKNFYIKANNKLFDIYGIFELCMIYSVGKENNGAKLRILNNEKKALFTVIQRQTGFVAVSKIPETVSSSVKAGH